MATRRMRRSACMAVAMLVAGAALWAAGPSREEAYRQIQEQFDRHNYRQVVDLACQFPGRTSAAGTEPEDQTYWQMRRLEAISQANLPEENGADAIRELMEQHEPSAKDPELWLAMSQESTQQGNYGQAYESALKAGELYEQTGQAEQAAEAYVLAAAALDTSYDILPAQHNVDDWQQRRRLGVDRQLELYDHAASLDVSSKTKATAYLRAGQAAQSMGDQEYAAKALERFEKAAELTPLAEAAQAQLEIGQLHERFNKYVEAVEAYQKVIQLHNHPALVRQARERAGGITAPVVHLGVAGPFAPGKGVELMWRIRNIRQLELVARRIDLVDALPGLRGLEQVLEQLWRLSGAEAARWQFDTPDKGDHQPHAYWPPEGPPEQPIITKPIRVPLEGPGAYVVQARGNSPDGRSETSLCLVVISELGVIAKLDADQALAFAQQVMTGQPLEGVSIALARKQTVREGQGTVGKVFNYSGVTAADGLAEIRVDASSESGDQWALAARSGEQQALCMGQPYWWGWGRETRSMTYGFTDRPVYRPGDVVHFKQVLRRYQDNRYHNLPDQAFDLSVRDSRGEVIFQHRYVSDKFGAFEGQLTLGQVPPLGVYSIEVQPVQPSAEGGNGLSIDPGGPGNRFRVEEYRKPEFEVIVEPGQSDYRIGQQMTISVLAKYYFGQPVASGQVNYIIRKRSYRPGWEWPHPWPWLREQAFGGGYGGRRMSTGQYMPHWWPMYEEVVTQGTTTTDADGRAELSVLAEPIKDHPELDLQFVVEATVTDPSRRTIEGGGSVKVTHAPFFIFAEPAQHVYGPGDNVEVRIRAADPNDKPVATRLRAEVYQVQRVLKAPPTQPDAKPDDAPQASADGRVMGRKMMPPVRRPIPPPWPTPVDEFEERLGQQVYTQDLDVPATGRASLNFVPDVGGHLRVILTELTTAGDTQATTQAAAVRGQVDLWVAPKTGVAANYAYRDLELVLASDQVQVGQTLRVLVNTAFPGGYVLLTGEATDLVFSRVLKTEGNSTLVDLPVGSAMVPNFTLKAVMFHANQLLSDEQPIVVPPTAQFIKVEVIAGGQAATQDAKAPTFQPRQTVPVTIRLRDSEGKPVCGQAAVFVVDASVYYIQPEFRQAIEQAFYGSARPVSVATADSFAGPTMGEGGFLDQDRSMMMKGGMRMGLLMDAAAPAPAMAMEATGGMAAVSGPALAATIVRKEFADTVFWAGAVTTDADGTAQVQITMPDQLTTFALHAVAADERTRVGQSRMDLVTTKDVIVRLEGGRFFTQGDRSWLTVIGHNYSDQPQRLHLDLQASEEIQLDKARLDGGDWQDYRSGQVFEADVPAGGQVRMDVMTLAARPGEVKLLARARSTHQSDAIELTRPILEWGAQRIESASGVLGGTGGAVDAAGAQPDAAATWEFSVPDEIKPNSQELVVTLSPSVLSAAIDALPFLADFPYGCVEQTMSRFLPTVIVRRTLQQAGIDLKDVREHLQQQARQEPKLAARYQFILERMQHNPVYDEAAVSVMVQAGLGRLAQQQHDDGSWGWWRNDIGDLYMTSYVTYGLTLARSADAAGTPEMLDRATEWLAQRLAQARLPDRRDWWYMHQDNDNARAFGLYALGSANAARLADKPLMAELTRLFDARDSLTDQGRAFLAMAMKLAGMDEQARIVVENFQNTAQWDKDRKLAHWGRQSGWWYWYEGDIESTAWAVQAMLAVWPDSPLTQPGVHYLLANRRTMAWGNTKSTAMAIYALTQYALLAGELEPDQPVTVALDGKELLNVRITRENLLGFEDRVAVPASQLPAGAHRLSVSRSGAGRLYWQANLRYVSTAERIEASGNQLAIRRSYVLLVPELFTNTRTVWKDGKSVEEQFQDLRYIERPLEFGAEIASGAMIESRLHVLSPTNLEYMMFEDPKPAGCEPVDLTSDGGSYSARELRDTKVAFFASHLGPGEHLLTNRLRCEQPGTFRILPASGEAMYSPYVQANSDSGAMSITQEPQTQPAETPHASVSCRCGR